MANANQLRQMHEELQKLKSLTQDAFMENLTDVMNELTKPQAERKHQFSDAALSAQAIVNLGGGIMHLQNQLDGVEDKLLELMISTRAIAMRP
jgi:hypothetical protein